ncbi:MAG: signal recognition particle-docking protein FtsY [Candidatus Neomarinimicrobiota bacterium]
MALAGKLFQALGRTRASLAGVFSTLRSRRITTEQVEELEETLLKADIGLPTVESITAELQRQGGGTAVAVIKQVLLKLLPDTADGFTLPAGPTVLMVVGVNGTGKTTSVAKLAAHYRRLGRDILLVGADTYRAAAVEQLHIWSERLGIRLICNERSTDPSAVLYDGLMAAEAAGSGLVIVDTAGRLHTYAHLMTELAKMYGVIEKRFGHFTLRTLITIDANLGQNSIQQAKSFARQIKLDGAILTKLDGTAKGGIVFPLYRELGLATAFIGVGEQLDDLYPFDPVEYIDSLFGTANGQPD